MSFAENKSKTRDKDACLKDYQQLQQSASYDSAELSNNNKMTAQAYVNNKIQEAPQAKSTVKEKLAIVTGVHSESAAYHIAQELAIQAGMHVMVLGKSESGLKKCCAVIRNEAKRRGQDEEAIILFSQKYRLDSLSVIKSAAVACIQQAEKNYDGKLHVLVNAATVGSEQARLTSDGIEYNTGCNFIGTHYFIKLLLPLLKRAAAVAGGGRDDDDDDYYKPRVVCTASIGHALGTNFDPGRLVEYHKEGGAPPGYIHVREEFGIEHVVTIQPNEESSINGGPMSSINSMTQAELAEAVTKRGTQVGRSKMGLVADVIHMARTYPEINFTSHHPGSTSVASAAAKSPMMNLLRNVFSKSSFSPSQGARAALRAALDPDMNTVDDLQGAYLHVNGFPWAPMDPASDPRFAKACFEAAEKVISELTKEAYRPPTYNPPVHSPDSTSLASGRLDECDRVN